MSFLFHLFLSLGAGFPSVLPSPSPPFPFSPCQERLHETNSNHIPEEKKKKKEEGERQQEFVNGNLFRGERGVCNAVYVPGGCLIAFGVEPKWLQTFSERRNYTRTGSGHLTLLDICILMSGW